MSTTVVKYLVHFIKTNLIHTYNRANKLTNDIINVDILKIITRNYMFWFKVRAKLFALSINLIKLINLKNSIHYIETKNYNA